VSEGIVGINPERRGETGDRVIRFPRIEQCRAEITLGQNVSRRDRDGARKERHTVLPILELDPRRDQTSHECRRCACGPDDLPGT